MTKPRKTKFYELRKARGLSQKALSLRAKIDQAGLCRIENGDADPRWSTVQKLAAALEVPVTALLG